jgi:hypothetical protein
MGEKDLTLTGSREKQSNEERGPDSEQKSNFLAFLKKYPVFSTIIIALVLMGAMYLWLDFQAKRERNRIVRSASEQIDQNNLEMLRLFSRPMVWSIRAEMLRGNKEQIDLLISDMVREKNFENIFVVDMEGTIYVSTTKRQEGQQAADFISPDLLSADATIIQDTGNNTQLLVSPVLGFDRRIGTLVIEYAPSGFDMN